MPDISPASPATTRSCLRGRYQSGNALAHCTAVLPACMRDTDSMLRPAATQSQDQQVTTEDLLYLLASFGDSADAATCSRGLNAPPPSAEGGINTIAQEQRIRAYLFCALRDRFLDETDRIQAEYNATANNLTATAVNEMQELLLTMHAGVVEDLVATHEAQMTEALAAKDSIISDLQNQLLTFHCSHVSLPFGEITGDTTFGGAGIDFACHAGYELEGVNHADCTPSGTWDIPWQSAPRCNLVNPCEAGEDDCHSEATCAHVEPAEHSCECNVDFTGTGQVCAPCSTCPDGWILTEPCTSTADTVCTNPCENVNCGAHGTCDPATVACVCDSDWTGPTCETPDVCIVGQAADDPSSPGPWIELLRYGGGGFNHDAAWWSSHCDAGPSVPPTDFVMWVQMVRPVR